MPEEKATHTVKVRPSTIARLYRLMEMISAQGWNAVGTVRSESPTQAHVIDEALTQLETKLKGSKK